MHLILLIEILITVISAYLNFRQANVALFYVLKTYILLFLLFGVLIAFLLNAKFMGSHLMDMLYLSLKILHFRVECIS